MWCRDRCGLNGRALLFASALAACLASSLRAEDAKRPKEVQIGICSTLYAEVPEPVFKLTLPPVQALVEKQTGTVTRFETVKSAELIAEHIERGKLHLGVMQGVELARIRVKHPELQPLVIACNQHKCLKVHVIVRLDSSAASLCDLRAKPFAVPRSTKEHSHLFLERQCKLSGSEKEPVIVQPTSPTSAEEALDDVVDGKVAAALIDGLAYECYQRRKPGRSAKLKDLLDPEAFPATVMCWKAGTLDETFLKEIKDGMTTAKQTAQGRQVLTLWKLTSFDLPPEDYERQLLEAAKKYPP